MFWVDLISTVEGFVSVRYFVGGYPDDLGLGGTGCDTPGGIGVHPVVLGLLAGATIGEFYDTPLQRLSLQVQGVDPSTGDRANPLAIGEIRFGGPDLNPDTLVPASEIAMFINNPAFPSPQGVAAVPEFLYESTGVNVPLNQWFRVGFEIDRKSGVLAWKIDTTPGEDVFAAGSNAATLSSPNNPGVPLTAGVTRIASLQFLDGADEGGNGVRVPPKMMVQGARNADTVNRPGDLSLLPLPAGSDPWNAPRPTGATAGPEDWCVYEVNTVATLAGTAPTAPLVQAVDGVTGALGAVRPLQSQDILAVYRRDDGRSFAASVVSEAAAKGIAPFDLFRTFARQVTDGDIVDAPGAGFGNPILPDCPSKTVNGSTDDGFIFLDNMGNEIVRGDWTLEGQPGQAGANDPFPNGGIVNDNPPYNTGVNTPLPDGSPGSNAEGFRSILLAQFYMTPDLGAPITPQRWYVDNIAVTEDCAPVGPGELLSLLADFSTFGPSGLLDLLSSFGGKHASCP